MRAKEKDGTTTTDFKSDLKFMDLSLVIGGGVAVGRASIEARYDAGLRDMAKTTSSLGVALKSRTFLVLVGIGGGK